MSQQYGGGPPGQEPPYGQQPPQYGQNPQQPPQYGQNPSQPPQYNQPQPPPQYGQNPPGVYQQPPQYGQPQPGNYPQPQYNQPQPPPGPSVADRAGQQLQSLQAAAPQVQADGYERTLSLLGYVWIAWLLSQGIAPLIRLQLGESISYGGINYSSGGNNFSFGINLGSLVLLLLPLVIMLAVRNGELVRFHAKQALYLGIAYFVAQFVVGLLYLIPSAGVQDVLVNGILLGLLRVLFVVAALFAGVRAFANREMYRIPVIGGFVK